MLFFRTIAARLYLSSKNLSKFCSFICLTSRDCPFPKLSILTLNAPIVPVLCAVKKGFICRFHIFSGPWSAKVSVEIKIPEKNKSEEKAKVSKNEAQVVAGQTLKERQDYYLKLSAKNEHTEDSIQDFYNTLKTGGSEITYNGAVLQQIRKMKSISINELAQITCIRGAYLKAIEEEDFSKFTSEIYLKGYLLCYAESMNLPTEKVLEDYIRVYKISARSENG